ncbi:MAG: preprotein translocase subunit SecE [Clostridia bacterium]|nr:preprotein translocase subunit SecE [Clostridia bacterium]
MAEEKKAVDTSEAKKSKKDKKPSRFSPKNIGKGIARFFKDLRGETKKIVWPGRQMVIKSTGIVIAAILVIGIGIWAIDLALSGATTAITRIAQETTTEAVSETNDEKNEQTSEKVEDTEDESTESTTAA